MNILKSFSAIALLGLAVAASSCSDKNGQILADQTVKINKMLTTLAEENPYLIADASAEYTEGVIAIDVKIADSLLMVPQITEPLFNFFTACEVKSHLDKELETTINAMSAKDAVMNVTLTDVYGDSHTYRLTAANFRHMVKSPLTQLNFNEARDAMFSVLEASMEQFRPAGAPVKTIYTSFKGGFYAYNVEFDKSSYYKNLTVANVKDRAHKILKLRFGTLGSMRGIMFSTMNALGIEGFHLVYTAGEGSRTISASIKLANI